MNQITFSQELKSELWSGGLLSIDVIKEYAIQYYQQVKNFPRYLSATHSITEDIESRKILLENLCDEENDDAKNGIINHVQLWKNFCTGMGLTESQVENTEIMQSTQNLIDTFYSLSKESTESGLATLYAQEHQYAKISESKRCGLKQFYNIDKAETVKFFLVHEKADIWHAEQLETLINNTSNELKSKIIDAGSKAMNALNGFLDGIVERFELDKISCI